MKKPAGFWIRVGAALIDNIIFYMGFQLISMIIPITSSLTINSEKLLELSNAIDNNTIDVQSELNVITQGVSDLFGAFLYILVIFMSLGIIYYIVIPYYLKGQTIGKWIVGIKMVKMNHNENDDMPSSSNTLGLKELLVRYTLAPSFAYLPILLLIVLYFVNINSPMAFVLVLPMIYFGQGLFNFINFWFIGLSYEKRGIHEIFANTKTVYVNHKRIEETTI